MVGDRDGYERCELVGRMPVRNQVIDTVGAIPGMWSGARCVGATRTAKPKGWLYAAMANLR